MNISSTSDLVDETPYESWAGKSPSLAHIKVFGHDDFVHIPKERIRKLDNKSEKSIFVKFKDGVKGYKLWNPATKTIVYSKDVIFREVGRTYETE